MAQIIWSEFAIDDLHQIADYISIDSETRAKNFVNKLFESTDQLIDFPNSGRVIPEFADKFKRELINGNYRIMYEKTNETIMILAIVHSSMDF